MGAFFAPVLYLGIIAGLIFLQFSGGSIFTENFGRIMLSGTLNLDNDAENGELASVVVEFEGIQFTFDSDNPLILETRQNTREETLVSGYRNREEGLTVFFDNGTELIFQHDEEGDQLSINTSIPSRYSSLMSLRIPFMLRTGASASATENFPGLDVNNGGERYILALPPRSYINQEQNLLNIPGDGLNRNIRYTRRAAGNENIFELWFENQMENIPEDLYETEIGDYIDRVYLAWKSNRYNSTQGTWDMREGSPRFSEEILVNVLSEAWAREEYTRVYNEMRSAADIFPLELSYRSSVFLGNLRKVTNDLEAADRQESIRIRNMINQGNAMVFLTRNLFRYATDRGSENLLPNLVAFTESLAPASLSPLEALGLAMNYYLGEFPDQEIRQILSRFEGILEENILPEIVKVDEGFFFATEPGIANSYYTILAGQTLIAAGEETGNEQFISLGKNMVLSILRLGDQMGFLPSQIELTAGAISATQGTTNPEEIYPLISDNPYYPRHISLAPYFGNGAWAYTIMNNYEIISRPGEFTINFDNSPNRTHFMFFRGIPGIDPLNGMELFGIIWRNAPDFEIYSKGRYYNADSNTLMIKFFDDDPNQTIRLFYE